MSENKTAKTPADGPEYERGFVEGMQRQMQLHVNRVIKEEPTGWVKVYETTPPKREWVGLTAPEVQECYDLNPARFASRIEAKLKEKNA